MFDDPKFVAKLESIERRFGELNELLGRAEIIANHTGHTAGSLKVTEGPIH